MAEKTTAVEVTAEEWRLVAEHRAQRKARDEARAEYLDPARPPTLTWQGEPVDGVGEPELREDRWTWRPHGTGATDGVLWPGEPMARATPMMKFRGDEELSIRV